MIVGQIVSGKIVVGVFSRIDGVSAGIKIIATVFPGIGSAGVSRQLRIGDPWSRFATAGDAGLQCPMIAQLGRGVDSVLGVAVIGIENGVTVGVVVRRQLRFNVRQRDISPDADIRALRLREEYRDPGST